MSTRLHINVDHVATLRQQRNTQYPDPIAAAAIAELAGVHGITVHLREDRRHIQDRDVRLLRETVQTCFNFEMAATAEMQEIALQTVPEIVTLVPESREELTTEGGLDVISLSDALADYLLPFSEAGIRRSLFIDPEPSQVEASAALGVELVELSTASFTEASSREEREFEYQRFVQAVELSDSFGMEVAAGHGLDYTNVVRIAQIDKVVELNIGHSIICRAVFVGLREAVQEMLRLLGHNV